MPDSLPTVNLKRVDRIWDRGEHNAFTDLCYFQNAFWMVFREGTAHVSEDGAIIVLTSTDARNWQLASRISRSGIDLRDPKIVVTPDQQLLITCAGAIQFSPRVLQSFLLFSNDGCQWSTPQAVGSEGCWIWRTRYFSGIGYGVGYTPADQLVVLQRLEKQQYKTWVDPLFGKASHGLGYPNEHDLFALPEDRMGCLLRRDADTATAQLGIAHSPFKHWLWYDLGVRIGGPVVLPLSLDSNAHAYLCAIRLYDPVRTSLCWLNVDKQSIEEILTLPSGGDTSYAGLVQQGNQIWCSYYSSHEGKTAIYLAELSIKG